MLPSYRALWKPIAQDTPAADNESENAKADTRPEQSQATATDDSAVESVAEELVKVDIDFGEDNDVSESIKAETETDAQTEAETKVQADTKTDLEAISNQDLSDAEDDLADELLAAQAVSDEASESGATEDWPLSVIDTQVVDVELDGLEDETAESVDESSYLVSVSDAEAVPVERKTDISTVDDISATVEENTGVTETTVDKPTPKGFVKRWAGRFVSWLKRFVGFE